jgi:hypothetical protein
MWGSEKQHHALRADVTLFVKRNGDMYAAFMEDDVKFEHYCEECMQPSVFL